MDSIATETLDLLCGRCGYNLREIQSARCPECGRRFDRNHLIRDLVPWEQRGHVLRFRAFWQTVWMASFQPRRMVEKLEHPMSGRAARGFALRIVAFAAASLAGAAVALTKTTS